MNMRVTPSRVLNALGLLTLLLLVLKFFPGLSFLNFGIGNSVVAILGSLKSFPPGSWFFPRTTWLTQMEETRDINMRHLEYYCEGPKLSEKRDDKEILLAVQTLIRHGDRGALFTVKHESHVDCPFDEDFSLPDSFLAYHETAMGFEKTDAGGVFDYVPEKSGCLNGQLTTKGVIQHLDLGAAVRRRLGSSADDWKLEKAPVFSTYYPRTYQSAMAFMHGLAPSFKSLSKNVHVAPAKDHMFCSMAETCDCSTANHISEEYFRIKRLLFEKNSHAMDVTNRIRGILDSHLEKPLTHTPTHIFDVLLQFACHGKRLPCFGDTCISYKDVLEVIMVLEKLASQLSGLPVIRQFSVVDAYGLLQTISDNLNEVVNGSVVLEKRFTLFSAHDATVVPVMHALGLPFQIVIPYASFVLFELYSPDTTALDQIYVRIIFNDEDVTSQTIPASYLNVPTKPLPLRIFSDFINGNLKREHLSACSSSVHEHET